MKRKGKQSAQLPVQSVEWNKARLNEKPLDEGVQNAALNDKHKNDLPKGPQPSPPAL